MNNLVEHIKAEVVRNVDDYIDGEIKKQKKTRKKELEKMFQGTQNSVWDRLMKEKPNAKLKRLDIMKANGIAKHSDFIEKKIVALHKMKRDIGRTMTAAQFKNKTAQYRNACLKKAVEGIEYRISYNISWEGGVGKIASRLVDGVYLKQGLKADGSVKKAGIRGKKARAAACYRFIKTGSFVPDEIIKKIDELLVSEKGY